MNAHLKDAPSSKELAETATLEMQTVNPIDLKGVQGLVRAVQAEVRTLNVEGNWSGSNYPEKELAEKFSAAVKDIFDALVEGKIEDPLNLAPVLGLHRAELEPQVVESIRVHVLGYIRGNLKDALQERREIHPNIFTMEFGSITPLGVEELTRLEQLRAAYIVAFTLQYLEHEALITNQKFPEKMSYTDLYSIRLAARYHAVDDIKLLLKPEKFAAYLNERGVPWTPENVQDNFTPSSYVYILKNNRDVLESSYRYSYALYTLLHPDALIQKLVSKGMNEEEIRTLVTSRGARRYIAKFSLRGENKPDDAVEQAVVSTLDALHAFDDLTEFAGFITRCVQQREEYPGIIVPADKAYDVVTKKDLYWLAVQYGSEAATRDALGRFLEGKGNTVLGRLNQNRLRTRLMKLSLSSPPA